MSGGNTVLDGVAALLAVAGVAASPATEATAPLQPRVETILAGAGPNARFGLVVADEDGRELVAIAPEGRFVPASSTKMFTIAAAFAMLPGLDRPDVAGGATVRLEPNGHQLPTVILEGRGDARLSSAPDCKEDCLASLADAVAAQARAVQDVIGDDSLFPDQRWSPGMSWNNMQTRSGTAVSALTLDDNELLLTVIAAAPGEPPRVEMPAYYTLRNEAVTAAAGGATALDYERLPGSRIVRLTGTIAAGAKPELMRLGIEDAADYAAWRLATLLEARGVHVAGRPSARHRPLVPADDPALRNGAAARAPDRPALARVTPPPLLQDLTVTAKISQNLHAELVLRRLARQRGSGSIADGVAAVRAMLDQAGVPKARVDFSDGSGMSTYNRVSPRGAVTFLHWAAHQPWGAAWRATLPVSGVDGTLARRFRDGPLRGRIFAKTGTLNQTSALVGYMVAKSGRTLAFAAFANDVPDGADAVGAVDRALELIAAQD
jgi:D-alanyl-D-alanine carboxypeptidase/D-alanyl-D-alanine-endopeptidase (penicillin-binding protein 4)